MGKRTPLYDAHVAAGAKIVDFAGWDMPLHYGSQLEEHHQVRRDAGLFDVSHMTIVDLQGDGVVAYLRRLLANNIDRLVPGKALYSCMLNERGGVIDDLIVYKIQDDFYRLVVNSSTREKDIAWLKAQQTGFDLRLTERTDLAILAVQGPKVRAKVATLFPEFASLHPFSIAITPDYFIATTGYTGEEGFEMMVPNESASNWWQKIIAAGVKPCGLGARDTLRLEAGLNLYGTDMDENVTPFESNLKWTVALIPESRDFIGRQALEKQLQSGVKRRLVGLVLETAGVLRNHQKVRIAGEEGEITSGSFSPTLGKGIAFARIPVTTETKCIVEQRGKQLAARIVKLPFVRQGKPTV